MVDMSMSKSKTIFLIAFACLLLSILWQIEVGISQGLDKKNGWKTKEGLELIGTKAPSWEELKWLNTEPLNIEDLRGKVVLIRFWLAGCPLCKRTASSLVELYDKYKEDGLIVVGIHHPKSERTKDPEVVRRAAQVLGFDFPLAQDNDWKVINSYWLGGKDRSFTSVSFLVDKKGVIRFVHDGGEFHKRGGSEHLDCQRAYRTIDQTIRELLEEE